MVPRGKLRHSIAHRSSLFKHGIVEQFYGGQMLLVLLLHLLLPLPPHPFLTGAWMTACGAHGWVARIASHWSIVLSKGWLTSIEAPSRSGHPSSIQLLLQLLVF